MRKTNAFAIAAGAFLALELATASAEASVIIEQELGGSTLSAPGVYWGQTFTTPAGGPWDGITVNFYDESDAPLASGTGYIFEFPYTGTPSALSSGGALASSILTSGGVWEFGIGFVLLPSTEYFFYEDAPLQLIGDASSPTNTYSFALGSTHDFTSVPFGNSINFTVSGIAIPEPATWAMFLVGFGALGFVMRGARGMRANGVTAI